MNIERLTNTSTWREEFCGTSTLWNNSLELEPVEADAPLRPRLTIMFPTLGCVVAVLLSFRRSGIGILVPISQYANPSCEFEIRMANSEMVAETWNSRVVKFAELPEFVRIGKISQEDARALSAHYNAVFNKGTISPTLAKMTGEKLSSFDEELRDEFLEYAKLESDIFPEREFVIPSYLFESQTSPEATETQPSTNPDKISFGKIKMAGEDIIGFSAEIKQAATPRLNDEKNNPKI